MENRQEVQELTLEEVMGDRFGRYSKYIIQERALPDIRDGLKPVQRRILFAMNKDGNTYDKGFRKSAKSVGNIMGNYHPHGDSSIYEAMVRMSQDWKLREVLIEIRTLLISKATMMIQKKNQQSFQLDTQTFSSMDRQVYLLDMQQKSRLIT